MPSPLFVRSIIACSCVSTGRVAPHAGRNVVRVLLDPEGRLVTRVIFPDAQDMIVGWHFDFEWAGDVADMPMDSTGVPILNVRSATCPECQHQPPLPGVA